MPAIEAISPNPYVTAQSASITLRLFVLTLLALVPAVSHSAEEERPAEGAAASKWRRWSLGGGITSMSTSGSYGNNAAIINTKMFGDDGIPFTGDPNEVTTCTALIPGYYPDVDPFCDPRPDDLIGREGRVEDAYGVSIAAGFDVTHYFLIAFDASYYRSEAGPIDVFATETYPFIFGGQVLQLHDRDFSEPIPAGEVTQIPLSLTALVRLRPDKAVRPYFGAGGGMILSGFEEDDHIDELEARLETLRIRGYANEKGRNVTPFLNRSDFEYDGGLLRFRDDIEVEVDDALEWHLSAGMEYMISSRLSLTFDARYLFTNQEVSIQIMDEDQIDIFTWPDELYRPDGSLLVFSPTGAAPNPPCVLNRSGYGCGDPPPPGKNVTPIDGPVIGPNGETVMGPPFPCPGRADFNKDGRLDYCYRPGLKSLIYGRDVMGMWVVQGGTIEMTGYSFAIGLRVHL